MSKNKIAIIGTAGIPAKYGGFETLVEYLTQKLSQRTSITVYCSSISYKNKLDNYNGVTLKYIPLRANGIQSILYDIISLFLAAKQHDKILILGVSGCVVLPIFRFFYQQKIIIINIDGLEHRRVKWNKYIRAFLIYSEKVAVQYADDIITDNEEIKNYVLDEYDKKSNFIAYGGDQADKIPLTKDTKYKYSIPDNYAFLVCRIEPENNVHLILEAFFNLQQPLVIIGNWDQNSYGKKLYYQYKTSKNIILVNAIYDQSILNQIRSNCSIYIHGHSAGGTNPSLVEAMFLGLPIIAFSNGFNEYTTESKAIYFKNAAELKITLQNLDEDSLVKIGNEMKEIASRRYRWKIISGKYKELF
jgi:glycosyltransferase involved in cell wall biosynthesis